MSILNYLYFGIHIIITVVVHIFSFCVTYNYNKSERQIISISNTSYKFIQ